MSLVDLAREEAGRQGGRVCALHLRIGALAGVVPDALVAAYEMAAFETPLEGSRLVIEDVPVIVYCPQCDAERALDGMQSFSCPVCGTPTPQVERGKELELVALEIES